MSFADSEIMRQARAASIARRPASALGPAPGGPSTSIGKQHEGRTRFGNACHLLVDRIVPDPDQPRKTFGTEADARLVESIRSRGQLVPVLVRWSDEVDRYVLVDGERRYRAAVAAGVRVMACVVEDAADPATLLEIQLVTNALREDVSEVEQAHAWDRLMKAKGYTHRQLAERLGYDHTTITRTVGLVKLPPEIQAAVHAGEIAPQTGYELSRIADPAEQADLAERAKAGTLRRDDLRGRAGRVRKAGQGAAPGRAKAKGKPEPIRERKFRTYGFRFEATRTRGFDLIGMAEALEAAAAEIRAELAEAG